MRTRRWLKSLVVLQALTLGVLGAVFPFSVMPKIGLAVAVLLLFATRYRVSTWDGATLTVAIASWGFIGGPIDLQTGHPWLVLLCLEFVLIDFALLGSVWLSPTPDQQHSSRQRALVVLLCVRAWLFGLLLFGNTTRTSLLENLSSPWGTWFALELMLSALALRAAWAGKLRGARLVLLMGLSFAVAPTFLTMRLMLASRGCGTQNLRDMELFTQQFTADLTVIALRALLIGIQSRWTAIRSR